MFRTLLFVTAVFATYVAAADVKLYSNKYDNIDATQLLSNDRLREQYYACFMETGPCTSAGAKFFTGIFAEALVTKCLKCTDKQKLMIGQIVEWYTANHENQWKVLVAKALKDAETAKTAKNA